MKTPKTGRHSGSATQAIPRHDREATVKPNTWPHPRYFPNEAAADLWEGASFGGSFLDVGACGGVHAHAGYHGHVQGAVQPAVAAAVDPVADGVSRRGRDRVHAGETGDCGFRPDPSGMGSCGKRDCRGDRSDAGLVKELARGAGVEECGHLLGV